MMVLPRTEVLTQMFLHSIRESGGHADLFRMSVDWIVTPAFTDKHCSLLAHFDGASYAIALYHDVREVALIGYDLEGSRCVINQIQGDLASKNFLPRRWESVLLRTVVKVAKLMGLAKVEVVPSWMSWWLENKPDPKLVQQFRVRYDQTPKDLGFQCVEYGSSKNHSYIL